MFRGLSLGKISWGEEFDPDLCSLHLSEGRQVTSTKGHASEPKSSYSDYLLPDTNPGAGFE